MECLEPRRGHRESVLEGPTVIVRSAGYMKSFQAWEMRRIDVVVGEIEIELSDREILEERVGKGECVWHP